MTSAIEPDFPAGKFEHQSLAGLRCSVSTWLSVDLTTRTLTPCAISTSASSSLTLVTRPRMPPPVIDVVALLDRGDRRLMLLHPPLLRADHQEIEDDEDQQPRQRCRSALPTVPLGWPAGAAWTMLIRSGGLDMAEDARLSVERWSGRLDSNQRPPHPQCDALPGCATPRPGRRHLGRATDKARCEREASGAAAAEEQSGQVGSAGCRRRCSRVPALYLLAALVGSLVPVNRGWTEPAQGTTDLPRRQRRPRRHRHAGQGAGPRLGAADPGERLRRGRPRRRAGSRSARASSGSISTRRPGADITPRTIWSALAGGERVMHVEYVPSPDYAVRADPPAARGISAAVGRDPRRLRARPQRRPQRIDHPGYGPADAFYRATGKASAIRTCNSGRADWLRLAGVKTSLWPPFVQGLVVALPQTAAALLESST